MADKPFTVTIAGPGINYKGEIQADKVAHVLQLCLAPGATPAATGHAGGVFQATLSGVARTSLVEYVRACEARANPELIVAIAAYHKEQRSKETFMPDEIRPQFRTIGETPPANFGRDFRLAQANAWIAQDDENPETFFVTNAGLDAVKAHFSGIARKKKKGRQSKKGDASLNNA